MASAGETKAVLPPPPRDTQDGRMSNSPFRSRDTHNVRMSRLPPVRCDCWAIQARGGFSTRIFDFVGDIFDQRRNLIMSLPLGPPKGPRAQSLNK